MTRPVRTGERTYRGFNLLHGDDRELFLTLARGEFNLSGFQNRDLRHHLPRFSGAQIGRALKRLRTHGLAKKVGRTYKYYLTRLGKRVIAAALSLREFVVIPALAT